MYMKQNKFIEYNNNAPTAWNTIIVLIGLAAILLTFTYTYAKETEYVLATHKIQEGTSAERKEGKVVQIVTETEWRLEQEKKAILANIRHCESRGNNHAIGDGGASVGPFQWQKATFEDKIGKLVTYEYYYDYVTDYDRIYKLTEEVYFEQGETYRWYNCTNNIKHKYEII